MIGSTSTANAVIVTIHVNSANAITAINATITLLERDWVTDSAPIGIARPQASITHFRASTARKPRVIRKPEANPPSTPPRSAAR